MTTVELPEVFVDAISELMVKIMEDALIETMESRRNAELRDKLYREISTTWNDFKTDKGWKISLGKDGLPKPAKDDYQIDFSMLSGGEKTILLLITRLQLSRYLARNLKFMIIDEPFEHLDAKNRHILLRFLIESYNDEVFDQFIITTVEEALLKKYIDRKYVNTIFLERGLKYY